MKKQKIQKIAAVVFLLLMIGFVFIGLARTHKVYEEETAMLFHPISERQLVVDATYSGVIRKAGKLYTTYDRSQGVGKRACPT